MAQGDIADRANDLIERELEARQAATQAEAARKPICTGRCLYCDDIVSDEARWCDASCRDQWESEQAARKRNGS